MDTKICILNWSKWTGEISTGFYARGQRDQLKLGDNFTCSLPSLVLLTLLLTIFATREHLSPFNQGPP